MTERNLEISGRRESDGTVRFQLNPKSAVQWVTLISLVIGLVAFAVDAVGSQIVKPPALAAVTDSIAALAESQQSLTQAQVRQNTRLNDVESRLSQMQVVLEIVAIQACRDLESDPYAYRKANCAQYLEGK